MTNPTTELAPMQNIVQQLSTLAQFVNDKSNPVALVGARYAAAEAFVKRLSDLMESAKAGIRIRVMSEGTKVSEASRGVATPYGTLTVTERIAAEFDVPTLRKALEDKGVPLEAGGDMKYKVDMAKLAQFAEKHGFLLTDVGEYEWVPKKDALDKLLVNGRVAPEDVMPAITAKPSYAVSLKADKGAQTF